MALPVDSIDMFADDMAAGADSLEEIFVIYKVYVYNVSFEVYVVKHVL